LDSAYVSFGTLSYVIIEPNPYPVTHPDIASVATMFNGPPFGIGTTFYNGPFDHVGVYNSLEPIRFTMTITNSTVPVPAAVWLLGSGLVALIGIRRKLKK
jgi:hypothetical protein